MLNYVIIGLCVIMVLYSFFFSSRIRKLSASEDAENPLNRKEIRSGSLILTGLFIAITVLLFVRFFL